MSDDIDPEFLEQTLARLQRLRSEQQRMQDGLVADRGQLFGLRIGLAILTGGLALGLGLSVGYQIGRQ